MTLKPEDMRWLAGLDPKGAEGLAAMTLLKAPPEAASFLVPKGKGTMPLEAGANSRPLPNTPSTVTYPGDEAYNPSPVIEMQPDSTGIFTAAPSAATVSSIGIAPVPGQDFLSLFSTRPNMENGTPPPKSMAGGYFPDLAGKKTFGIPSDWLVKNLYTLSASVAPNMAPGRFAANKLAQEEQGIQNARQEEELAMRRQEFGEKSIFNRLNLGLKLKEMAASEWKNQKVGPNTFGIPEQWTWAQADALSNVMPKAQGPMSVAPGHVVINPQTGAPIYTAPAAPEKPINMPPWYDALGMSMFGSKYNTPEGQKAIADWVANPTNKGQLTAFQQEYAKNNSSPVITYLQTSEGFVPAQTRGPEVGKLGAPTGLGAKLPSEMVVANQQIGTLKETMAAVKAGYNPDYVGPIAGRTGALAEKTIGISPERAMFNAQVAQLQNSLIYLMSGKQINESEYVRLKKQIPDINLPARVFEARMKEFDRTVDSIIANREKNMGGYGNQRKPISQPTPLDVTITKEDALAELRRRGKIK